MAKVNKTCHVCGSTYSYCPTCDHKGPSYKAIVCSDTCNAIWDTLSKNGVGLSTAAEATKILSGIKMPKTLQPGIQAHINRLKAEVKPIVVKRPVVVTDDIIPVKEVVTEENAESEKVHKKKKVVSSEELPQE